MPVTSRLRRAPVEGMTSVRERPYRFGTKAPCACGASRNDAVGSIDGEQARAFRDAAHGGAEQCGVRRGDDVARLSGSERGLRYTGSEMDIWHSYGSHL